MTKQQQKLFRSKHFEPALNRCFENAHEAQKHGVPFQEVFEANVHYELRKLRWHGADINWFLSEFTFVVAS
jgi:hypothetical protein